MDVFCFLFLLPTSSHECHHYTFMCNGTLQGKQWTASLLLHTLQICPFCKVYKHCRNWTMSKPWSIKKLWHIYTSCRYINIPRFVGFSEHDILHTCTFIKNCAAAHLISLIGKKTIKNLCPLEVSLCWQAVQGQNKNTTTRYINIM